MYTLRNDVCVVSICYGKLAKCKRDSRKRSHTENVQRRSKAQAKSFDALICVCVCVSVYFHAYVCVISASQSQADRMPNSRKGQNVNVPSDHHQFIFRQTKCVVCTFAFQHIASCAANVDVCDDDGDAQHKHLIINVGAHAWQFMFSHIVGCSAWLLGSVVTTIITTMTDDDDDARMCT